MCGRTACTLAPNDICDLCSYKRNSDGGKKQRPVWRDPPGGQQYYPSYNMAPGSHTPVIISGKHCANESVEMTDLVIQPMRWGLVPSWHKGDPKNVGYETNNCRSEGMMEKRTYRAPLNKGRRCVVLADGFFEWKRDKDKKQPYFIYFPQSTFTSRKQVKPSQIHEKTEPGTKSELFGKAELAVKTEPVVKTESVIKTEPVVKTEPKIKTEPVVKTEPVIKTEPVVKSEPVIKSEPVVKSEPGINIEPDINTKIKCAPSVKLEPEMNSEQVMKTENYEHLSHPKVEQTSSNRVIHKFCENSSETECTKENHRGCDNQNEESGDRRLLTMAGVFDIWNPPDGSAPLYSYSIITTESSPVMSWIHHRMPAILTTDEEIRKWLDFGDIPLNEAVKCIHSIETLQMHPVSSVVNNSRNKSPECIEPFNPKKPKPTASSNLMMSWLSRGKKSQNSGLEPAAKKIKTENLY